MKHTILISAVLKPCVLKVGMPVAIGLIKVADFPRIKIKQKKPV